MKNEAANSGDEVIVLFDGACPLCRREIGLYERLDADAPVRYCDISRPDTPLPPGLDRQTVLRRFHVRRADGEIVDGARAFVALWERLPGWRWLAKLASIPGVTPLLELGYRLFLPLRPWLQRVAGGRAT